MKMRLLITFLVCSLMLFGCSNSKGDSQNETKQQADVSETDIKAMQAEIDSLKEQLEEQKSNSKQTEEDGKKTENSEEGRIDVRDEEEFEGSAETEKDTDTDLERSALAEDIDDLANRFKVYIEDHSSYFNKTRVAFVELSGNTPVLLYVDQMGLKGFLRFDGQKTEPIASERYANQFEVSRFDGYITNIRNDVELILYYREKENKFALYKHEYGSGEDIESNSFFEINDHNKLVEVDRANKIQYIASNGKVSNTIFHTLDSNYTNRENYDKVNEKCYEGLNKSIDLINDTYETVDEAIEAYKSKK